MNTPGDDGPAPGGGTSRPGSFVRGRGATISPPARFLARHSEPESDGWHAGDADEPEPAADPRTQLLPDHGPELITRNRSPDVPFDRSINPYKGCEHGCIYCFARPTHAYLDLSPGLDFETRIFYKTNVRESLRRSLGRRGYQCAPIALGTNTDPYQPAERTHRVTRAVLEVLLEHRHPITIVTKGQLVLRDIDLLQDFAAHGLVRVALSLTTLDAGLKARLEPRAASGAARLRVLEKLAAAGIPTQAMLAPIIPFLNDHELESMAEAAARAGVGGLGYVLLRLPHEVGPLFRAWLDEHHPQKAGRIMAAVRASRGGRDYDARWGTRMRGEGEYARLIGRRFALVCKRLGLDRGAAPPLRTDLFRPPTSGTAKPAGDADDPQLALFGE